MRLERITIAANQMAEMAAYYNALFDANLKPIPNSPFYTGQLVGIELMLCSNEVAGVVAKQNRQQFRITVPDIEAMRARVQDAGGNIINEGAEKGRKILGITDPDGNTLELIEQLR